MDVEQRNALISLQAPSGVCSCLPSAELINVLLHHIGHELKNVAATRAGSPISAILWLRAMREITIAKNRPSTSRMNTP